MVKGTDLTKPQIIDINVHLDDRGSVYGAFDNLDWHKIKRTYVVRNWQAGTIRAWHGHFKAATYIHVIKGTAKVAAKHMDTSDVVVGTLSSLKPQLFYVPPGWYNGTMTLQEDTRLLIYSTLTLEKVKEDDEREEVTQEDLNKIWKVIHR